METSKTKGIYLLDSFIKSVSSIVYPHHCAYCGRPLEDGYFCEECYKKLPFIEGNTCSVCGCPVSEGMDVCYECKSSSFYFYKNVSIFMYTSKFSDVVHKFKYHNGRYLAKPFGAFMAERLKKDNISTDFIIPVPLHPRKEEERGYNQSGLLAKYIGRILDISVLNNVLVRDVYTQSQTKLKKESRRENMCGAFSVKNKEVIYGKTILLIDDIFTTGSTMNECSRVLLNNGAGGVYSATLATGR